MSVLKSMPEDIRAIIIDSGLLPDFPIVVREMGEILNDLEARISSLKICAFVMPVLPAAPVEGAPTVFFQRSEIRVRAIENRKLNDTPLDVYQVAEAVCIALQASNPGDQLSAPLELSNLELTEDEKSVALDCIFLAAFGLDP